MSREKKQNREKPEDTNVANPPMRPITLYSTPLRLKTMIRFRRYFVYPPLACLLTFPGRLLCCRMNRFPPAAHPPTHQSTSMSGGTSKEACNPTGQRPQVSFPVSGGVRGSARGASAPDGLTFVRSPTAIAATAGGGVSPAWSSYIIYAAAARGLWLLGLLLGPRGMYRPRGVYV